MGIRIRNQSWREQSPELEKEEEVEELEEARNMSHAMQVCSWRHKAKERA